MTQIQSESVDWADRFIQDAAGGAWIDYVPDAYSYRRPAKKLNFYRPQQTQVNVNWNEVAIVIFAAAALVVILT